MLFNPTSIDQLSVQAQYLEDDRKQRQQNNNSKKKQQGQNNEKFKGKDKGK